MIIIDANLLLYAHDEESKHHAPARAWLEGTLAAPDLVGLPLLTIIAFLRIGTNPRLFQTPLTSIQAATIVAGWLDASSTIVVHPTDRHWPILWRLLDEGQARGALVTDAHLAALAVEHGATLCTTDRDFARFPGLRWENPLVTE